MRWPDFFGFRARGEVDRLEKMLAHSNGCLARSTNELIMATGHIAAQSRDNEQLSRAYNEVERRLEAATFQLGNEKRIWGYVTDEAIADWAKKSPDEKTAQIAILTMKLARETAKVMEIEAARSELAMRLKNKRYNQADEMEKYGLPRELATPRRGRLT